MNVNNKTILVTGCAGFIGSNFAIQFKKKFPTITIVGIDDLSAGKRASVPSDVIFYKGSITNEKLLDTIFKKHKISYIFHFAALPRVSYSVEEPVTTSKVNILGTVALLRHAKNYGVKRFIFSSSSAVYGKAGKLPTKESENTPDPKSPYAAQKHTCEVFCKMSSELHGLDTVSLRYFNVFGPGQYGDSPYSTVISAWLEVLYFPKKKKAFIEGDGSQSRDFCYVDDVVLANILAMTSNKDFKGEVFNIGSGEKTIIRDVKKLIESYSKRKLNLDKHPKRVGDVKHTHADISKAKKWFGFEPKTSFEEGLKETIEWFESRKK